MVNRPARICRMLAAGLALALALAGCSKIVAPVEADGLGLPKVELRLTSEDYGTLNSNVYARLQVPAELQLEGRRWQIKVRYSGQTSINNTKKSVTFEFPEERRFRGHRFYGLSAQSGDPTGFNPIIGFYAFAQAGLQTPEVQPVTFYVNGEYWGLYFLIEPIDEDFFARRGQRLGTLYEATRAKALLSFAEGYDVRMGFENKGERADYFGDLEKTIRVLDESQPQELPARLAPLVDAENWLRYLAVSVLLHNFDGYINNYRLHKSRLEDPFRIIPWDVDHLLEIHPTRSSIFGEPKFSERLLRAPEYRRRYRAILLELMDETLRVERLDAVLDETAAQIAQALAHDRFLGGDAYANAARRKESLRQWYAKIRADLVLLE